MGTQGRGTGFDLRPLGFSPTLARPSFTPADGWHRLLGCGPQILGSRTNNLLLQAVGASSVSSLRTTTPHGGGGELGVGGSARCAGAYDRTRVRTRVNARAWQGLRRRFKAPCHRLAALNTDRIRGWNWHGMAPERRPSWENRFFFSPLPAKTTAWARLVGHHRVQKRSYIII